MASAPSPLMAAGCEFAGSHHGGPEQARRCDACGADRRSGRCLRDEQADRAAVVRRAETDVVPEYDVT